jgi:hypothetical protein
MNADRVGFRQLFSARDQSLAKIISIAAEVSGLIEKLDPFVQGYSAVVCSGCPEVCCINRHLRYDLSDRIYMHALGCTIPNHPPEEADTEPCRFLGKEGCGLDRSLRPYRCTWFFCATLLDHIQEHTPTSLYREFITLLRSISEKRQEMIEEYHGACKEKADARDGEQ